MCDRVILVTVGSPEGQEVGHNVVFPFDMLGGKATVGLDHTGCKGPGNKIVGLLRGLGAVEPCGVVEPPQGRGVVTQDEAAVEVSRL